MNTLTHPAPISLAVSLGRCLTNVAASTAEVIRLFKTACHLAFLVENGHRVTFEDLREAGLI